MINYCFSKILLILTSFVSVRGNLIRPKFFHRIYLHFQIEANATNDAISQGCIFLRMSVIFSKNTRSNFQIEFNYKILISPKFLRISKITLCLAQTCSAQTSHFSVEKSFLKIFAFSRNFLNHSFLLLYKFKKIFPEIQTFQNF